MRDRYRIWVENKVKMKYSLVINNYSAKQNVLRAINQNLFLIISDYPLSKSVKDIPIKRTSNFKCQTKVVYSSNLN